jgi:predicted DNA-binding transcriptional regulator AlpA
MKSENVSDEKLDRHAPQIFAGYDEHRHAPVFVRYDQLPDYGIRYSRVHLLRLMRRGQFPLQVQISPNRVAWRRSAILEFVANRPTSARVRVETGDAA